MSKGSSKLKQEKLKQEDKTQVCGLVFLIAYNTMMTSGQNIDPAAQEAYLESLMRGTDGT